jgi:hypothetical protein
MFPPSESGSAATVVTSTIVVAEGLRRETRRAQHENLLAHLLAVEIPLSFLLCLFPNECLHLPLSFLWLGNSELEPVGRLQEQADGPPQSAQLVCPQRTNRKHLGLSESREW